MELYEIVRREKRIAARKGKVEGKAEGKAEDVLLLLEEAGSIPDELREYIMAESDEETLKQWLKAAAVADSIETFRGAVSI